MSALQSSSRPMVDRTMARNSGNPDAVAEVPDSKVTRYASSTYFDIHSHRWMTFDPESRSYVPVESDR